MPKEQIQDLIESRKNYQIKFVEILKKYYIKFIERLYEKSLREFQEKLLKIPYWSHEKLDKEYTRFLKFTHEKYDLQEEDLINTLHIIYGLNIKIMTSICNNLDINAPKLKDFLYKCLKRVAKYYYEHPKIMLSSSEFKSSKTQIEKSVKHVLQQFIPLKKIINSKNPQQDKYNFDNGLGDIGTYMSSSINNTKKYNTTNDLKIILESENNLNRLKYIPSNEYYISDDEKVKKINKGSDEKSEVKYIKIYKKNYKNTQQIQNNLDENFFDNI